MIFTFLRASSCRNVSTFTAPMAAAPTHTSCNYKIAACAPAFPPSNPLRTALYETRQKPCFFVLARCPCATSGSYNVVTARHARCTHTYVTVPCIRFTGHGVITLRASLLQRRTVLVWRRFLVPLLYRQVCPLFIIPPLLISANHRGTLVKLGRGIWMRSSRQWRIILLRNARVLTLTARMFVPG